MYEKHKKKEKKEKKMIEAHKFSRVSPYDHANAWNFRRVKEEGKEKKETKKKT